MSVMENRYFIAIVPPEPLYEQAMDFKNHFAETYHSKGALLSPPHITLHMPFMLKNKHLGTLQSALQKLALTQTCFEVQANGFGAFGNRVIYLHIENSPALFSLYEKIAQQMRHFQQFNASHRNHGFVPHLTLAFRDLKPPAFSLAWPNFKETPFESRFIASKYYLLVHDGRQWQLLQHFDFN